MKISHSYKHFLYNKSGSKYIDMFSCFNSVNQGYNHKKITDKILQLVNSNSLLSNIENDEYDKWKNKITNLTNYKYVFPLNSNYESFIFLNHLTKNKNNNNINIICHNENKERDYKTNNIYVKLNDITELNNIFNKYQNLISSIYFEPILSKNINIITNNFYNEIQKNKVKYPNFLIISNEIQTGLSRTSNNWFYNYNIKPDIIILGNSLTSGILPFSCILTNYNLENYKPININPLSFVLSSVSLDIIKEECFPKFKDLNPIIDSYLYKFYNKSQIKNITGTGLYYGIHFDYNYDIDKLYHKLLNEGYYYKIFKNILRISPPLTISNIELNKALHILLQNI